MMNHEFDERHLDLEAAEAPATRELKEVFDREFANVRFDGKMVKALYQFQINFISRNHEHMEFFGSNLLGVHVIRFKPSDVERFFSDVLDLDYNYIVGKVREVKTINHTFKVSGDVLNLTLMYVMHRCLTSKEMTKQQQIRSSYDAALIFFYRCICALCSDYFSYPVDPKVGQAAYARLSNKFLIKQLGTWQKVMDYRTKDLVVPDGLHYPTLIAFEPDDKITDAIADAQGRIRDMVKNYYGTFVAVHSEGGKISVSSSVVIDADGEQTLRDHTKGAEVLVQAMRNIFTDKDAFIREDLVAIVAEMNSNTSPRMIRHTLNWLCESYPDKKLNSEIDEFISTVVTQSQWIINNNIEPDKRKDKPYVLITLKNIYLSTRTTDPEMLRIRKIGEKLIKKANGRVSNSLMLATRTAIIIYITLRSLAITS